MEAFDDTIIQKGYSKHFPNEQSKKDFMDYYENISPPEELIINTQLKLKNFMEAVLDNYIIAKNNLNSIAVDVQTAPE